MVFSWRIWISLWLGIAAGIVMACFGLLLLWRGIANHVRRDTFGDSIIPRWLYVTGGIMCAFAGCALLAFLIRPEHRDADVSVAEVGANLYLRDCGHSHPRIVELTQYQLGDLSS